ncbi:hypothetical protein DL98DRAFT_570519 [Cadophora sp. DSE1049]|nr:hypothetical protein DL98DRAFT_570519 [Cadophora sp. DSE1049]
MARPSIYIPTQAMEPLPFEWNVFEQFLTWHQHQDPTSDALIQSTDKSFRSSAAHHAPPYVDFSIQYTEADLLSPDSSVAGEKSSDLDVERDVCRKEPTRRRIQNRKAQRAFRLRQKMHVESLEERLRCLVGRHEELRRRYVCLRGEYERVAGGRGRGSLGSVDGRLGSVDAGFKRGFSAEGGGEGRRDSLEDREGEEEDLGGNVETSTETWPETEFEGEQTREAYWRRNPSPPVLGQYQQQHYSLEEGKGVRLPDLLLADVRVG